jgi:hypothetical protein
MKFLLVYYGTSQSYVNELLNCKVHFQNYVQMGGETIDFISVVECQILFSAYTMCYGSWVIIFSLKRKLKAVMFCKECAVFLVKWTQSKIFLWKIGLICWTIA